MSGRVTWLRDGERVTGYRKTNRRNRRTRSPLEIESPEPFRLSFSLPREIAGTVAQGPSSVIGVTVGELDRVDVIGHGLEWVCKQAADFLGNVALQQNHEIRFVIFRGKYRVAGTMIYVPGASVIFPRHVKRALVFAVT